MKLYTEEIMEGNKLCAEFLNLHRDEKVVIYKMNACPYEFLKFHSDWNWLMEINKKIYTLPNPRSNDTIFSSMKNGLRQYVGIGHIEASFLESVRIIKWYNENNQLQTL